MEAKYNQRHGNKEQTDINQRGRGEGDNRGNKGKGHQGTYIEETRTKTKGVGLRVGGREGWGMGSGGEKMKTTVLEQQ